MTILENLEQAASALANEPNYIAQLQTIADVANQALQDMDNGKQVNPRNVISTIAFTIAQVIAEMQNGDTTPITQPTE